MERIFRRGLAAFRWGAWLWLAAVVIISSRNDYLKHPKTAVLLVVLAFIFTAVDTIIATRGARDKTRLIVAIGELMVGFLMMALDGYVRRNGIIFENAPTLGSWWPVVGLIAAATYLPRWAAALAGLSFGLLRFLSTTLNGISPDELTWSQILSLANTGFFAALVALTANGLVRLLRNAENEVALARARDELARTLHDGVLQTLALVERRSTDPELVSIVRNQEREVRELLNERTNSSEETDLRAGLSGVLSSFELHHQGTGQIVIAPDLPDLSISTVRAFLGASREAMNNAAKHGNASMLTIYVEPGDESGVICSVTDNGTGFDTNAAVPGFGTANSIHGRMAQVGGTAKIKSTPGTGTEVELWAP